MVTPHPRPKEARKDPSRLPTRTTGSEETVSHEDVCEADAVLTERIVDTEVETTVHDDTNNGGNESTVETGNTVGGEGLTVDVDQAVELTGTSTLGGLGVVGETGSGVVEGVDEEEGGGTSSTTGGNVTTEPLPVSILLLEAEERLEVVLCGKQSACNEKTNRKTRRTEGKVQGLGGEVTDDVGGVSSPEGDETLIGVGTTESITDTLVRGGKTTLLDLVESVLKLLRHKPQRVTRHTISSWFCTKSLIRSMGAADVFETAYKRELSEFDSPMRAKIQHVQQKHHP